jgi:hypothetical protein
LDQVVSPDPSPAPQLVEFDEAFDRPQEMIGPNCAVQAKTHKKAACSTCRCSIMIFSPATRTD